MREDLYQAWLEKKGKHSKKAISSYLSRLKRIETAYGNIDDWIKQEKIETLIETFHYTKEDENKGRDNPTSLIMKGNIYKGLASLKTALRSYSEFSLAQNRKN